MAPHGRRGARAYDLAIVGAGFAGLSCARSAALRGEATLCVRGTAQELRNSTD